MSPVPPNPRQAVVIIHGIGEQRPMETLRQFVAAVTEQDGRPLEQKAESKPDHLSPTLELRRMAVPGSQRWSAGQWVSTDFYELYWAHPDDRHRLAPRDRLDLDAPAAAMVGGSAPTADSVVGLLDSWHGDGDRALHVWQRHHPLVVATRRSRGNRVSGTESHWHHFGLKYGGDAARYLNASPENVAVRHDIRAHAVELLEKLHDDTSWRRYHRIVVVGHSLGSVIAYDALSHLWQRRHHPKRTFVDVASPTDRQASGSYREQQAATWRAQRAAGVQWKITDFITLGSPLAHAPFLMASDRDDFRNRTEQREYPTCPPKPNDSRDFQYGDDLLLDRDTHVRLLHHAALFACTRWTNFYFHRDIIGGPIGDLGDEIVNTELESRRLFPHTDYWRPGRNHDALRDALELEQWWTEPDNVRVALQAQQRETDALTGADVLM